MKKFSINSLSALLPKFLRKGSATGGNPNNIWILIIVFSVVATSGSAFFAFLNYRDVSANNDGGITIRAERDAMSTAEIRTVVDLYDAKQAHFQELIAKRPVAPTLDSDFEHNQ